MIRKHPDIIAAALLLLGFGIYSCAREARILRIVPVGRVAASHAICRTFSHVASLRSVRSVRY